MRTKKINPAHKFVPLFLQTLIWFPTRLIFAIFGKYKVYGKENLKDIRQAIFAVNHTSELDPITLTSALLPFGKFAPMFYVAAPAQEFKSSGLCWRKYIYTKSFFHAWGSYPIVRGTHNYKTALQTHVQILKQNGSICIFPEGGITRTNTPKEPKGGVIYLARETGVPIIPVAISGTYQMTRKLFWGRRRKIILEFGTPIYTNHMLEIEAEQYHNEASDVFAKIISMIERHKLLETATVHKESPPINDGSK